MTWVRIDDRMVEHDKWVALEADPREWSECMAVWVAVACYSARNETDGFIDWRRLERLTPLGPRAKKRVEQMTSAGLFDVENDGARLHDWAHYNPTRVEKVADRALKTERQRRWREGKTHSVDGVVDASTSASVDASRDALVERRVDGVGDSAPTRPVPSPSPFATLKDGGSRGDARSSGGSKPELAASGPERMPAPPHGATQEPPDPTSTTEGSSKASPRLSEPPSSPSDEVRISELSKRYPGDLLRRAYDGCRLSRSTGKMAPSVWRATLEKLDAYALEVVAPALETFADRYADGSKDERYLLGIVRNERGRMSKPGTKTSSIRLLPTAEEYDASCNEHLSAEELFGRAITQEDIENFERISRRTY